jgi:hypothetical protein
MKRSPESICYLCCQKPADKKGSHLIPAFLISTGINFEGSRERDKEFMVMFRKDGFIENYFGRGILPEKIALVKDKELSEDLDADNINPNIKDYFFCNECEKRLSTIENYFAGEIYAPIEAKAFDLEKSSRSYDLITLEKQRSELTQLFFLSIVWRIGIGRYTRLRLPDKTLNRLRRAIHSCLDEKINNVVSKAVENRDLIFRFPLVILYSSKLDDPTKGIIYCDDHKTPHFLFLNQFILHFYEDERHLKSPETNTLFETTTLIDRTELVNNKTGLIKIGILNNQQVDSIRTKILELMVHEILKEVRIQFSKAHEIMFNFRPPNDVVYTFANRISKEEALLFDRFSSENVYRLATRFLFEIYQYIQKHNHYPRFGTEEGKLIDIQIP